MQPLQWLCTLLLVALATFNSFAQQLRLGNNPYAVEKSAVLELQSTNQGLLLSRIADTAIINTLTPPDGMVIFFTPAKQFMVRSNGYWQAFAATTALNNYWSLNGNSGSNPSVNFLGTTNDKQMILKSNNQPYLEFGRRQTLGLTQGYTDYDNNDEKVTYLRSALQFEAANASFYKPKMFTDANGNFRVKGSSAGTDYFEFGSTGTNNNGGFEFIIGDDGDEPMVFKSYNYLTGMSEIMRLQSGRMAVGSNAFDASNPEKLLIDAGTTTSYNLMTGKGSIDNYLQINVQNRSAGGSASSDLVATANNGSETDKFIDMGINSSGYTNNSAPVLGGANTAYLYSTGNDFVIGNTTASRPLRFFTGGSANANERMRIDGTGYVGIGTTAPSTLLHVKTGTSNDSGLRLENLTSSSSTTTGAAVLGVDANGKVVRAKTPVYYSGTGTATAEEVTKIWVAEITYSSTNPTQTISIPANIGFSTILGIQLTAKGGSGLTTAPIATIVSNTTSSIVIRVVESKTSSIGALGGTAEGLEQHSDNSTKIYVRVEGY